MRKLYITVFSLATALICSTGGISHASEPIQVTVSILPQKYFVDRIAGDLTKVSVMVPPGSNPASYEPRPSQMKELVRSKIYFAIGVPFENVWLKKIKRITPMIKIVHTDQSVEKRKMPAHPHPNEEHYEKESLPVHGASPQSIALDPHIWLSPILVKAQALAIADALIKTDPAHKKIYEDNSRTFQIELDRLDAEIREMFRHIKTGSEFFVFHPSWGYFAYAYGLKQVPIEIEGKNPSAAKMGKFVTYAKEKKVKAIFVQPQFSTKSAETIAREVGARVVIADPLCEDWMKNLIEVAEKIRAVIE